MNKQTDDEFDMPEVTAEMLAELRAPQPQPQPQPQDLQPGAATVKSFNRGWSGQHGPQPPGPGLRAVDYLILAMFAGTVALLLKACSWALFS